jgi:hypothetical protein
MRSLSKEEYLHKYCLLLKSELDLTKKRVQMLEKSNSALLHRMKESEETQEKLYDWFSDFRSVLQPIVDKNRSRPTYDLPPPSGIDYTYYEPRDTQTNTHDSYVAEEEYDPEHTEY